MDKTNRLVMLDEVGTVTAKQWAALTDRRIVRAFRGAQMVDQEIHWDNVTVQLPTPPRANRHERRKQAKLERVHGQAL